MERSEAYRARLPISKRTSPAIFFFSSDSRACASFDQSSALTRGLGFIVTSVAIASALSCVFQLLLSFFLVVDAKHARAGAIWTRFEGGFIQHVAADGEPDGHTIAVAARQRLTQMLRLAAGNHRRQWRLMRIDHALDHCRTIHVESLSELIVTMFGFFDMESLHSAGLRDFDEIDGREFNPVFGIAKEDHLLPLD